MMKLPAGSITISKHSAQSKNVSFGLRYHMSLQTRISTPSNPASADGATKNIETIKTSAIHRADQLLDISSSAEPRANQ